nr:hypothetical protein [Proteus terrae subsp. cibarius]
MVYEIGPGKGIITRALLGRCRQVVAIEYDAELYRRLLEQLKGHEDLVLLNRDFLTVDLPSEPYKVFSNIPFNMTADILSKLLTTGRTPEDLYLVMQQEAVYKYAGEPLCQDGFKSLLLSRFTKSKSFTTLIKRTFRQARMYQYFCELSQKEYCDIKNCR